MEAGQRVYRKCLVIPQGYMVSIKNQTGIELGLGFIFIRDIWKIVK
jgi:hypothetical protein